MTTPPRLPSYLHGLPFHLAPRTTPLSERERRVAAARAGDAQAAMEAASMLFAGEEGPVDVPLATELLRGAAERGSVEALLMLGGMLWGLDGHEREGVRWLQEAAAHGAAEAIYVLGMACARGRGLPRDLELARRFLEHAERSGILEARDELARIPPPS
ncbi:tetratricopeptide repeat protein [Pyxidicoccus caerfyrddinensis]|uniref:tetratricopeptide repeat protein n=1 Tax=Pyxidicoccus caerfyrddinensis TaxID=2709663 RepID=UPI0013DB6302|nr:SEL1-like repeat protein [Pyxidicoccus caerfyrddinensis]